MTPERDNALDRLEHLIAEAEVCLSEEEKLIERLSEHERVCAAAEQQIRLLRGLVESLHVHGRLEQRKSAEP